MIYFGTTYKCVLNNFSSSANNPTHATYWGGFSSGTGVGGNGITVDTVGGVSTISTNIVNGTNTIVQYNDDKSIQINASTSGLTTVNGGMAIGVDKTYPSQPTINLLVDRGSGVLINEKDALQLQHGEGLDVILDSDGNGTLVNSGVLGVTAVSGVGISVNNTDPQNPILTNTGIRSLTAGTGISSSGSSAPTISNTGVLSITAGTGLSSTGGQNPTITNDGILSITTESFLISTDGQNPTISALVAQNSGLVIDTTDPAKPNLYLKHGKGLDVDVDSEFIGTLVNTGILTLDVGVGLDTTTPSGSQNPVLINDGVITLTAGTGLTSTGGQYPTITNNGIISLGVGTGITSTGGQTPTITNSGILSLTAGYGLDSTGGQNPTLVNDGVIIIYAGTGITSTGGQTPTIANSGVLDLTAGTGVTITGSKTNYTISASPVVSPTIYTATYYTTTVQTITGGHTFNGNLVWTGASYSTPSSMSISSQSGGGSSMTLWRCPINGVWSISLSMTVNYTTLGTFIVMLEYNNSTKYYLPKLNVIGGTNLSGDYCSSMTGTNILKEGSLYCISTQPNSTVDVTFGALCAWTLTYLGPSP